MATDSSTAKAKVNAIHTSRLADNGSLERKQQAGFNDGGFCVFGGNLLWHQIGNTDRVIQEAVNTNMVYQGQKQHGRWLVEERVSRVPAPSFLTLVAYVVVRGKRDRGVSSCVSSDLSLNTLKKITRSNSVVRMPESRDSLVRYQGVWGRPDCFVLCLRVV